MRYQSTYCTLKKKREISQFQVIGDLFIIRYYKMNPKIKNKNKKVKSGNYSNIPPIKIGFRCGIAPWT